MERMILSLEGKKIPAHMTRAIDLDLETDLLKNVMEF
jgi:hypothetical protein